MWWEIMKFKKAEILKIFSSKIFRFIVFRPLTTKKNFKSFSLLIWKPPIFQFEIFLPNRVKKDFAFCCLLNRLFSYNLTVRLSLYYSESWTFAPRSVTVTVTMVSISRHDITFLIKKSRYGASIQSRSRFQNALNKSQNRLFESF